ncbi:MAG: DUF4956 domain-containing protein [Propionibacteriaceae bacterium]|nr:DUF4956 domain-containing protein [Propionibacteriaceae bacterium]
MSSSILLPLADVVAILVLALALYWPRHRRLDLTMAYLAINVGVLGVSIALSSTSVNAGLGLGLFGVLAIIRLRSCELDQHEVAYYFSSLALAVIGGLGASMGWGAIVLMGAIVAVLAVVDAPVFARRYRSQSILIDRAIADEAALRARVEQICGGRVVSLTTRNIDLVDDTTLVDAHYVVSSRRRADRMTSSFDRGASPIAESPWSPASVSSVQPQAAPSHGSSEVPQGANRLA